MIKRSKLFISTKMLVILWEEYIRFVPILSVNAENNLISTCQGGLDPQDIYCKDWQPIKVNAGSRYSLHQNEAFHILFCQDFEIKISSKNMITIFRFL